MDLHNSPLKSDTVVFNAPNRITQQTRLDIFGVCVFEKKEPLLIFNETYTRSIKQENGLDFSDVMYNL